MRPAHTAPPATLELECGPVSAVDLALYAAASSDHNPLHLDEDTARAAGFERPVVHGMLSMAFAARLFSTHFGAQALRSLETRFTGVAQRGTRIVLRAELQRSEGDEAFYGIEAHDTSGSHLLSGSARLAWRAPGSAA